MFHIPKKEDNKQLRINVLEDEISKYREKVAELEKALNAANQTS